jgi:catalase
VGDNQNSLTVRPRGPVVFEDILLFEKMAHFRLLAYPDAHRYRLGVNYDTLPVNKPQCPVHTYNRDGFMRFDGNCGSEMNYEPNSFNGPTEDPAYRERPRTITGSVDRHDHRLDSDYYTQPGNLFRLMAPGARERLIGNIVASMKSVPQRIQELQIEHFYKADAAHGTGVAKGLGLNCNESNSTQSNATTTHTLSDVKGANHAGAKSHQDYFGRAHRRSD